jgi:hypothetical protein
VSAGLQVVFAGLRVEGAGPHFVGAGPHLVGVGPIVVGSGFGPALVVNSGPLSPWEPWAVEDADVNLPPALHKASNNNKSG